MNTCQHLLLTSQRRVLSSGFVVDDGVVDAVDAVDDDFEGVVEGNKQYEAE